MTIDEAIKHAEEVADKKKREKQKWDKWLESDSDHRAVAEKASCELCAAEHRQLAEWLKDYKRLLDQEPCGDCISREETLEALMEEWTEYDRELIGWLYDKIDKLPSVTPQPKMGRWSHDGSHWENRFICSECRYKLFDEQTNYCPNCGAKMSEIPTGAEGREK